MPWQGTNVVDPYHPPIGWWHDLGLTDLDEKVEDTTE
jgi:hypothetical protein